MDKFFNSTVADASAGATSNLVNSVQHLGTVCTSAAVAFTALLIKFETGRKILARIFWFFDGMLGGGPHAVSLPGPPGLPVVGNLLQVISCRCSCGLSLSNLYVS
jgi:hypothetical protein